MQFNMQNPNPGGTSFPIARKLPLDYGRQLLTRLARHEHDTKSTDFG